MSEIQMPYDDELEQNVIAMAMFDADAAQTIVAKVSVDDFYTHANRVIFTAVSSLTRRGQVADLMATRSELMAGNKMDDIGGVGYLAAVFNSACSTVGMDDLIRKVLDYSARRRVIRVAQRAQQAAMAGGDVAEVISGAEEALFAIREKRSVEGSQHISDTLITVYNEIERRYDGDFSDVIPTGLRDVDRMIGGGFRESELVVIAGRPGMGKSAFCGDIAAHVAGVQRKPVLVFTLEMSNSQLVQRLLARQSKINGMAFQTGMVRDNQWSEINAAVQRMSDWPIWFNDSPDLTPASLRAECRRMQRKHGLGLVVVDHIGLMDGDGKPSDNRVQEVGKISRSLKKLAKEFRIPVIALAQLNRGVESRTNKRPMLSDLRESGSIEQDTDKVLLLYRDEYYNPDGDNRNTAEVIIGKFRSGPAGTVNVFYNKAFASFEDMASDWAPEHGHGFTETTSRMPRTGEHWTNH